MSDKPPLPRDLTDRGFVLVMHEDKVHMHAVSSNRGCTATHTNISTVIRQARAIAADIERLERRR